MIRAAVSGDTRTGPPLSTLLAVWKLTPARAATSLIETYRRAMPYLPVGRKVNERSLHQRRYAADGRSSLVSIGLSGISVANQDLWDEPERPCYRRGECVP